MPAEVSFPSDFAAPRPYTPQKPAANGVVPASQPNTTRTKPRSGNKPRAKPAPPSSPGPSKQGRNTPPQATASKAVTAAAFAGATFHASPAPSSLPIPSFLAKAALDSPGLKNTTRANREPSPPATDSEAAPTPQHRFLAKEASGEESPLDVLFRADRAEKERARRASSANVLAPNPRPFSPPAQPQSPPEPRTLPNGAGGSRNRRPASQRISSAGISSSELDGTPGRPMGPAFSTPFNERIRAAARSTEKQIEPAQTFSSLSQQDQQQQINDDLSERLKRFLAVPSAPPPTQSRGAAPAATTSVRDFSAPAPQQIPAGPTARAGAERGRPPELLKMENNLRRMLNIGPGSNPGTGSATSYQSS